MSPIDAVDGSSGRHVSAMELGAVRAPNLEERPMQTVTTMGLDIKVGFSGAQGRCRRAGGDPSSAEASRGAVVL